VYCLPQYRIIPQIAVETFCLGLLMVLTSLLYMGVSKTANRGILLFGLLLSVVNLFSQLTSPFPPTDQFYKILFLAICFIFITEYFVRVNPVIQSTFKAHILLASILVVYGSYIYLVGDVEGTQTTEIGWKTIGRYWGFRYTASTRNDDIFYIVPAGLIILSYALFELSRPKRVLYLTIFFMFAVVTFLSFSRGHILAMSLTAVTAIFLKMQFLNSLNERRINRQNSFLASLKMCGVLIGTIVVVILLLYSVGVYIPEFNLLVNLGLKLVSIIDPSAQAEALNMTSSNSDRLNIYFIALDLLTKYPLGVGAENFQYASMAEGHGRFWGESTYLEYLVGFGVLGGFFLPVFLLYPVIKLYYMFKVHGRFLDFTYFSVSLYIAIACLFNVFMGNLYFYLLLSMIYAYIIHHKKIIYKRN